MKKLDNYNIMNLIFFSVIWILFGACLWDKFSYEKYIASVLTYILMEIIYFDNKHHNKEKLK